MVTFAGDNATDYDSVRQLLLQGWTARASTAPTMTGRPGCE